eukprot:CAMPEP_0119338422 /NCGR_PEP_ID=MMETSP1333-20130426/95987_1 /TAXON_ID=418940 /ORGANISM="Scyphosphaera apsteinii, Strain RCC1455" /LENGTH=41 /DNA_ID= /DNA_START= /DNA_END= /DNA_ORIENTATION=
MTSKMVRSTGNGEEYAVREGSGNEDVGQGQRQKQGQGQGQG